MKDGIVSSLREQGKAIIVMMMIAILSVVAMIVLDYFQVVTHRLSGLGAGNVTGTANWTITTTINFFITAFGLTGSFASITVLIIVIKGIIGVVRGMKQ